jgi:hypothetical protein
MRVRVGQIGARCESCGCEDFQPARSGGYAVNELACFSCGASTSRRALVSQIADETVRRAERFLAASRSGRKSSANRSGSG